MPSAGVADRPDDARAGDGEGSGFGGGADAGGEVLVRSAGIAERGAGEVLVRSSKGAVTVTSPGGEVTAAPQTEQYREFAAISLEQAGQLGTSASYQSVPRSTQSPAPSSGQTVHLVLRDADLHDRSSGSRDADLRGLLACSRAADLRGSPIGSRDANLCGLFTCSTGRGSARIVHLLTGRESARIAHPAHGTLISADHFHNSRDADLRGLPTSSRPWIFADGSSLMLMGDQIVPAARRGRVQNPHESNGLLSNLAVFQWLWICLCSRHDGRT